MSDLTPKVNLTPAQIDELDLARYQAILAQRQASEAQALANKAIARFRQLTLEALEHETQVAA